MSMRELRGKINKTNRFALYFAIRKNNHWIGGLVPKLKIQ